MSDPRQRADAGPGTEREKAPEKAGPLEDTRGLQGSGLKLEVSGLSESNQGGRSNGELLIHRTYDR